MTKRKLEITIGIVALLVGIGLLAIANNNPNSFVKIPIFSILWQVFVVAWEFFWGFLKLFSTMFWVAITQSWLSVLVFIGIIILIILGYLYRRR